jgi:predicted nucleic acid-binding protein
MGAAASPNRDGLRCVFGQRCGQQRRDLRVVAFLVDTSILVRLANRTDALYLVADRAILELHRRAESLHITAQNLIEFRNVATRPKAANGLGLAAPDAEAIATGFEATFPMLAAFGPSVVVTDPANV